jgi:hypothetical protein
MKTDDRGTERATALMMAFAARTGLSSDAPVKRYLWTDAFAVCNFLSLWRSTGDNRHAEFARRLIDQVHRTLGRRREDDSRSGWISGLSEDQGRENPTVGGLRIGKILPERRPEDPFDERLEWERDGQYYHYLVKWMHALNVAARSTGETSYVKWACELAGIAGDSFVHTDSSGRLAMYWKMSIDLSRPLVPSMGHHDPLEGYVTLQQLLTTARAVGDRDGSTPSPCQKLDHWLSAFAEMVRDRAWATSDPLGVGGLLANATHLLQLLGSGGSTDRGLLMELLGAAQTSLYHWTRSGELHHRSDQRLAFRELGLAIGLRGVLWMCENLPSADESIIPGADLLASLRGLSEFVPVGRQIEAFWLEDQNRRTALWTKHEDINSVMLATALTPEGFLVLPELGLRI